MEQRAFCILNLISFFVIFNFFNIKVQKPRALFKGTTQFFINLANDDPNEFTQIF